MARYFLLNGVLIPVYEGEAAVNLNSTGTVEETREYYTLHGIPVPRSYRLATIGDTALYVAYFAVDQGRLVIRARTRRGGYAVANAVQAYLSLICDIHRDHSRTSWWLSELARLPRSDWSLMRLIANIIDFGVGQPLFASAELRQGTVLFFDHLQLMPKYLSTLVGDQAIAEAFRHLGLSRLLFDGTMNASYYHFHYRHDRRETSRSAVEKRYFEERE